MSDFDDAPTTIPRGQLDALLRDRAIAENARSLLAEMANDIRGGDSIRYHELAHRLGIIDPPLNVRMGPGELVVPVDRSNDTVVT